MARWRPRTRVDRPCPPAGTLLVIPIDARPDPIVPVPTRLLSMWSGPDSGISRRVVGPKPASPRPIPDDLPQVRRATADSEVKS